MHRLTWMIAAILAYGAITKAQSPEFKPPATVEPAPSERVSIRIKVEMLLRLLGKVEGKVHVDDFASAAIYSKAATQIERLGEFTPRTTPR